MTGETQHDGLLEAVSRAVSDAGYWLPGPGCQAAAQIVAAELAASQRRAIRIQALLDDTRDRMRKDAVARRESERILQQQIDAQAKEIDRLRDEVAALHEGEEELTDALVEPTPAQWIWQWNHATPGQRLDMAGRILQAFGEASRCFMEAHVSRAEDGRAAMAALGRVRAELDHWTLTTVMPQTVRALDDIRRALEPPKEQP